MMLRRTLCLSMAIALSACGGTEDKDTGDSGDSGNTGDSGDSGPTDTSLEGDEIFADACDVIGVNCQILNGENVGFLTGTITDDLELTANASWVFRGGVFIGTGKADGATTLTIEEGTTLYGDSATDGFMVITRFSKIMAEGTKDAPIVFTSDKAPGSRGQSDWGGLIINGNAPVNTCSAPAGAEPFGTDCDLPGEAGSGSYGGPDEADSSGTLTYVRIEFAGTLVSATNELNGVAFQGVGSGTTIDNLHAHKCADDGVEFFGGTAQATHVIVTGTGDDGFDWTDGWRGKVQWLFVNNSGGDNGMEMDNNEESDDATPRSRPMIQNATVFGGNDGMRVREGSGGIFERMLVVQNPEGSECLAIDDLSTYNVAGASTASLTGDLVWNNSWISCSGDKMFDDIYEGGDAPFTLEELWDAGTGNGDGDPKLTDITAPTPAGFLPTSDSPAKLGSAGGLSDSFFTDTDYVGAFGSEDWTAWSDFSEN